MEWPLYDWPNVKNCNIKQSYFLEECAHRYSMHPVGIRSMNIGRTGHRWMTHALRSDVFITTKIITTEHLYSPQNWRCHLPCLRNPRLLTQFLMLRPIVVVVVDVAQSTLYAKLLYSVGTRCVSICGLPSMFAVYVQPNGPSQQIEKKWMDYYGLNASSDKKKFSFCWCDINTVFYESSR